MEYRDLGRTGLTVSEIGFGAWAIGSDAWGPVEDADSLGAMELGINFIDTADVYGDGRSESLVSKVISGRLGEVVVSTKGGLMGQTGGDRGVHRGLRAAQEGRQGPRRRRLDQRPRPHRALQP